MIVYWSHYYLVSHHRLQNNFSCYLRRRNGVTTFATFKSRILAIIGLINLCQFSNQAICFIKCYLWNVHSKTAPHFGHHSNRLHRAYWFSRTKHGLTSIATCAYIGKALNLPFASCNRPDAYFDGNREGTLVFRRVRSPQTAVLIFVFPAHPRSFERCY